MELEAVRSCRRYTLAGPRSACCMEGSTGWVNVTQLENASQSARVRTYDTPS